VLVSLVKQNFKVMAKNFLNIFKKTAFFYIFAVFLITLDRLFKLLATNNLLPNFNFFDFFSLSFAKNYYIAFSLPLSGNFLIVFILAAIALLIYYFIRQLKLKNKVIATTLFFIILGAASNLLDRLKFGFVVDYLDLKYFTIFNIADAMISCGMFLLIYVLLINKD